MTDDLVTLAELQSRLDWELDTGEEGVAKGAISDLSDDARFYGSTGWTSTSTPRQVKSLILRAVVRFMRNPEGFVQSRAGDETLIWSDQGEDAGTAYFTERERKQLAQMAGRGNGLVSVGVVAYGPTRRSGPRRIDPLHPFADSGTVYAQADSGLFPWYAKGEFS